MIGILTTAKFLPTVYPCYISTALELKDYV